MNRTPLHWALMWHRMPAAALLLRYGADPIARDPQGQLPILLAESDEARNVVGLLVLMGSPVNEKTRSGSTALSKAAERGDVLLMNFLIHHGALSTITSGSDDSALSAAARMHQRASIEFLLQRDATEGMKTTALIEAVSGGYLDIVKPLLKAGADVNVRSPTGCTLLHSADPNLIPILVRSGLPLNAINQDGETAAHFAARRGDFKAFQMLDEYGIDIFMRNVHGETPKDVAASYKRQDIVAWYEAAAKSTTPDKAK